MAYIDDLGNHYNDDTTELIQVNSKLKCLSIPSSVRITKEFAFLNSRLDVIIFNSKIDVIEGVYGLRVSDIYVPLGFLDHFVKLFHNDKVRDFIREIDFEKVELYYNIGITMLEGDGVSRDAVKALEYLEYCAKNHDVRAVYRLAQYYEDNHSYIKAHKYYQKAADFLYKDASYKAELLKALMEEESKKRDEEERRREQRKRSKYLFFDTETTGLPKNKMYDASPSRSDIWPRLVQIAWLLVDCDGNVIKKKSAIIYPDGFTIPQDATNVHHITTERARREGLPLLDILEEFMQDFEKAECLVAHNIEFDQHIIGAELYRLNIPYKSFMDKGSICTMRSSTNYCKLPNPNGYDNYKWPKLEELYSILFERKFVDAHDALADITATKDCFFELKRRGVL